MVGQGLQIVSLLESIIFRISISTLVILLKYQNHSYEELLTLAGDSLYFLYHYSAEYNDNTAQHISCQLVAAFHSFQSS